MLRSEKVAHPLTALRMSVPASTELPGSFPRSTNTTPAKVVSTLANPSMAHTRTDGAIAALAAVFVGCTVKTSVVTEPGVIKKVALVSGGTPVELAMSRRYPAWTKRRFENVAIPATAATAVVPPTEPESEMTDSVTVPVKLGATFPFESSADTCTVCIGPVGSGVKASLEARRLSGLGPWIPLETWSGDVPDVQAAAAMHTAATTLAPDRSFN
jgi:hypothetical protein